MQRIVGQPADLFVDESIVFLVRLAHPIRWFLGIINILRRAKWFKEVPGTPG